MADFQFTHLEQAPASGNKADRVVIVLHGYGSNKEKAFEQAPWIAAAFPDAHIYATDGTFPFIPLMDPKSPDMGNEPVEGRRVWYQRYSEATRQEGLATTREKLDAYIDECAAANGLTRERVALLGLSQGAITLLNCSPSTSGPSAPRSPTAAICSRRTRWPRGRSSWGSSAPRSSARRRSARSTASSTSRCPGSPTSRRQRCSTRCGISTEFHLLTGLKHADCESRSQAIATEFIRRKLETNNHVESPTIYGDGR